MMIVEGLNPPSQEEMTAVFAGIAGTGGNTSQQSQQQHQQQPEQVPMDDLLDFDKTGIDAYGNGFGSHFRGV